MTDMYEEKINREDEEFKQWEYALDAGLPYQFPVKQPWYIRLLKLIKSIKIVDGAV